MYSSISLGSYFHRQDKRVNETSKVSSEQNEEGITSLAAIYENLMGLDLFEPVLRARAWSKRAVL
jgi:hypothetical protein